MSASRNPNDLRILVAMPNYGPADLAIDSVRSLAQERLAMPGLRVGICENGSGEHVTRQLAEAIHREGWTDWVYVHEVAPNRGFAGGTNAILRDGLAWPDPPDYFWLLNTDTLVQPGVAVPSRRVELRSASSSSPSSSNRRTWGVGTGNTQECSSEG
jgi:GT2 family glycosyltransferase